MFLAQLRETCMTIALNRVAGTRFLVCVAAVLGSGCVDSPTSYRVEGAKTDFCVPGTLDATPSRRGHEDPVVGGFTLHGCYSAHSEACIGPDNLISAAVVAKSHFPGRRFGDLPQGSHLRTSAIEGWQGAKTLEKGLLAVPDGGDKGHFFVWRPSARTATQPSDDDELMASCDTLGNVSCSRVIHGDDFAVTYSFVTEKEVPNDFSSLDRQVLNEVERMRCRR